MAENTHYLLTLVRPDGSYVTTLGFFKEQEEAERVAKSQAQSLLNPPDSIFRVYALTEESLVKTFTKSDFSEEYKALADNLDAQLQNIQKQLDTVRAASQPSTPNPE
jgi:hypothetical protein